MQMRLQLRHAQQSELLTFVGGDISNYFAFFSWGLWVESCRQEIKIRMSSKNNQERVRFNRGKSLCL